MCWKQVENKCKSIYEFHFINIKIPTERKMLIHIIAEEYPELPRIRIAFAVDKCIATLVEPITPTIFVSFVRGYLS